MVKSLMTFSLLEAVRYPKQWLKFGSSLVDGSLRKNSKKNTAAGELTIDPFPQHAYGTGPNRTRAQWKFTNVYHQP